MKRWKISEEIYHHHHCTGASCFAWTDSRTDNEMNNMKIKNKEAILRKMNREVERNWLAIRTKIAAKCKKSKNNLTLMSTHSLRWRLAIFLYKCFTHILSVSHSSYAITLSRQLLNFFSSMLLYIYSIIRCAHSVSLTPNLTNWYHSIYYGSSDRTEMWFSLKSFTSKSVLDRSDSEINLIQSSTGHATAPLVHSQLNDFQRDSSSEWNAAIKMA